MTSSHDYSTEDSKEIRQKVYEIARWQLLVITACFEARIVEGCNYPMCSMCRSG